MHVLISIFSIAVPLPNEHHTLINVPQTMDTYYLSEIINMKNVSVCFIWNNETKEVMAHKVNKY
jgi:hypothetical protein